MTRLHPCVLVLPFLLTNPGRAGEVKAEVRYNRDVRPILSNRCFKCHGPDLKKAGLDLTSRDGAVKKLKDGATAVVPGKSALSEMIARVTAGEGERMPPKGDALTPQQIEVLKHWINQGAVY